MKLSKKLIIIITTVLVLIIGGGIAYATNTPTARAERQLDLGNKYLQDGKYQEAIIAFEKVIQIDPKNIPARLGLGKAYVATKAYEKAEAILKEVISIDKNNIPAREELFNVYIKENKLDAANSILQEISKIDLKKDIKQLNSELDSAKAISISKTSYDQGIKQMNDKQYSEAITSFHKVIKEDKERYDDAQKKINDCKKAFIDTTLQKAKDAASKKDYQTALDLIEQVLKVDPNNADALSLKDEYIKDQNAQKQTEESKATESKASSDQQALDYLVQQVPEVSKFGSQIKASSNGKVSLVMYAYPPNNDKYNDYYAVYVGESHPDHTVRWNTFLVNKTLSKILVWDIASPESNVITLDQWRSNGCRFY